MAYEDVRTNAIAPLFSSCWQRWALGCLFFGEYGEAMLSRLLMTSKEVGHAQSVQQTCVIFLTLPSTLLGEKFLAPCFASKVRRQVHQRSLSVHSKSIKCLVLWACFSRTNMCSNALMKPQSCVSQVCCPILTFQSKISFRLMKHSLTCFIAQTQMPEGVEDFINTYAKKCSNVDQRQPSVQYLYIHTLGVNASKRAAKPARRVQLAPGVRPYSPTRFHPAPPPP